jgi:hypothetical protein
MHGGKMSDLKDQIYQNITNSMDIFKQIGSKIPGFKGYVERQNRRDSDKLIRDTIYRRFRELEGRVSSLQVDFINKGEIQYTDDLEKAALRFGLLPIVCEPRPEVIPACLKQ